MGSEAIGSPTATPRTRIQVKVRRLLKSEIANTKSQTKQKANIKLDRTNIKLYRTIL